MLDKLNAMTSLDFCIKEEREVPDRWTLLQTRFKKKMREEESSNGIAPGQPTERETLIQALIEKEDTTVQMAAFKRVDKDGSESPSQRALERFSETKKEHPLKEC